MPPKRVKKPKKPVQQKQKQKQSQRVVVNVNQARPAKRRPVARARQPQQVVYQPLITMSGSVPVPQPSYNPIQSSGGFNPTPPPPSLGTPISSSAPVELPVFADESVKVVGDEPMTAPIPAPVSRPVDIIVPIRPVIPDDTPVVMPKPIPPPKPIITSPPPSLVTDGSDRSKFIIPPQKPPPARSEMNPNDGKSVGTLLSELSKDTGINPKSVADFLFKKKNKPVPVPAVDRDRPPARVTGSQVSVSTGSSSDMNVPETILTDTTKADYLFLDDRSIPAPESISSMSGFNPPSNKSSIKKKPVIAEPKEPVVIKKPKLKRADPYDPFSIFSDNESIARDTPLIEPSGDIASDAATQGTYKKPAKKREVVLSSGSERDVNIIPLDKPAGRRIPPTKLAPVKEKKSSYVSKADLQQIAKDKKINIFRPTGKEKTMNELRIEIAE